MNLQLRALFRKLTNSLSLRATERSVGSHVPPTRAPLPCGGGAARHWVHGDPSEQPHDDRPHPHGVHVRHRQVRNPPPETL